MNRNIKAEYDGKHFTLTAEQSLHIVAGDDTELFDEVKAAIIEEIQGINEVHHERILQ